MKLAVAVLALALTGCASGLASLTPEQAEAVRHMRMPQATYQPLQVPAYQAPPRAINCVSTPAGAGVVNTQCR